MLDDNHPDRLFSEVDAADLNAEQAEIDAELGFTAFLSGELRQVDRLADPGHDFVDDSRVLITLDKPLYRFGAAAADTRVITAKRNANSLSALSAREQNRLAMLTAYFDVLIADFAYIAAFEEMTLKYLRFDDAREKMEEHGELAEVDVRALEAAYLDAFAKRTVTESEARASRLRLALSLNRPDAYPDQLVEPDLKPYQRPTPDYETLLNEVLENGPAVRSAQLLVEAAQQSVDQLQFTDRPTLGVRLRAAEYAETFSGSRDQFRGSVYLDVPLVQRRKNAVVLAERSADLLRVKTKLEVLKRDLRIHVLHLVQKLEEAETELAAAKSELLYQELKLDKVRLQYEMELRARIGSANADVAKAILRLAKVRYRKALLWERIHALAGRTAIHSTHSG